MEQALELARKGINMTHPNPAVGCVIVRDGQLVGQGWHQCAGELHAEVIAIQEAGDKTIGATMYVTLEPCSHYGQTPPCVQTIIRSRVHRVVIATSDPNPLVNRKGIFALQKAGIKIDQGLGEQEALYINRGFFKRIKVGIPWVTLKIAISLDGKVAMKNGESQWITSNPARVDSHNIRAANSAILTGVGTILRDNPSMNVRLEHVQRQPLRIILDSSLSTPVDSAILRVPGKVLIMTTPNAANNNQLLERKYKHVEVCQCPEKFGHVDLFEMMNELGRREINSVMLEAGPRLNGSMLLKGLVDELVIYIAPDILGSDAREMFRLTGLDRMEDKIKFNFTDIQTIGRDVRLTLSMKLIT